ncbi:MAG: PIN domain-containing protein [Chloroflexi bacterium]|nr:PIN domain-containing protein [Chloroflexota bacterium]
MRITLDTTYLLPVIGVAIKGLPHGALLNILQAGHEISISGISVFELAAKAGKLISAESLTAEKASRGITALIHDERIERIPVHHTPLLTTAFRLRGMMNDFIDCSILATALHNSDILVTEDGIIHDLSDRPEYQVLMQSLNSGFLIRRISEVL